MTPIPVGVQRLAAQLAHRMPWLVRGRHIGALTQLLYRHRLDADAGWSAERLLHLIESHNRATGHVVPDPTNQRSPLGYLNTLLTAAIPQPRRWQLQPAERMTRALPDWQLEDEKRRRHIAAEDPARRAAVIAQIRADIARDRARVRNAADSVGRSTKADPLKKEGDQ